MSNEAGAHDQRRKELEQQWRAIKAKANDLASLSADLSQRASYLADAADLGIQAAQYGSPYGDWEASISSAHVLNQTLDQYGEMEKLALFLSPVTTTSGSAAVYHSSMLVSSEVIRPLPSPQREPASQAQEAYSHFFERSRIKEDVLQLMEQCGFNATTEGRVAVEKFRAAWEMFENEPSAIDSALSSLIPLRESIELTIAELIRRRPTQRKAADKIQEIGQQLAADSVPLQIFEDLECEYGPLTDTLSGSKRKILVRETETELMRGGTYFLRRLLSAVDPVKLR
jgi:hypothetical protein